MADEEVIIVEDDRRRLKDGRVEARGHWAVRGNGRPFRRKKHTRRRR